MKTRLPHGFKVSRRRDFSRNVTIFKSTFRLECVTEVSNRALEAVVVDAGKQIVRNDLTRLAKQAVIQAEAYLGKSSRPGRHRLTPNTR